MHSAKLPANYQSNRTGEILRRVELGKNILTIAPVGSDFSSLAQFIAYNRDFNFFSKTDRLPVYVDISSLLRLDLTGLIRLLAISILESCEYYRTYVSFDKAALYQSDDPQYMGDKLIELLRSLGSHKFTLLIVNFNHLEHNNEVMPIYNFLAYLHNFFDPNIKFIFHTRRVEDGWLLSKTNFGDLSSLLAENIYYFPLPDYYEFVEIINHFADYKYQNEHLLHSLSGGFINLVKPLLGTALQSATSNHEVMKQCQVILHSLGVRATSILQTIALGSQPGESVALDVLTNLAIVRKADQKWELSSSLMAQYLRDSLQEAEPLPLEHNLAQSSPARMPRKTAVNEDELTANEYAVYKLMSTNPGQLITKEEIGKIIWGKDYEHKYSPWAIDQMVMRLRKKIDPSKRLILTKRGRGLVWQGG